MRTTPACGWPPRHYCTPTFKNADIVVSNAYPQNAQAFHAQRWIALFDASEAARECSSSSIRSALDPIHFLNNRSRRSGMSWYSRMAERVARAAWRKTLASSSTPSTWTAR